MIKLKIPVVVEGKYDKARLSGVIDATIITTNGFAIFNNEEKRSLLRTLGKDGVVVLCDSDGGGRLIRSHLKGMLDQTAKMTDAEVREEIDKLAAAYSVTITSDQRSQLLSLVRNLEGLDTGALQDKLVGIAKAAQNVNKATETISHVFDNVKGFFSSVGSFFTKLFGRNS